MAEGQTTEPPIAASPGVASFEKSLEELEKVVKELEAGDLALDRAMELFSRGMELSESCRKQLEEAETRVEMMVRKDGEYKAEPLPPAR